MNEASSHPEATVGALILNGRGQILLTKSYKWRNRFTLPGGHIELGETAVEALKREVKEEVGMDVEVGPRLIVQEFIFGPEFAKRKHFIFLTYLCYAKITDVKIDHDEMQSFEWMRPEDALKADIDTYTRETIEAYLKLNKP